MGKNIDFQPHFGHQLERRKALYAKHAAQMGEKTALHLLSDKRLEQFYRLQSHFCQNEKKFTSRDREEWPS